MSDLADEWKKPPLSDPPAKPSGIEESPLHIYYDGRRGSYYRKDEAGDFIIQKEGGIRRFLKSNGLSDKTPPEGGLSMLGQAMEEIERKFSVHHVGEVAGYKSGLHKMGSHRVLVTRSPEFIPPVPGDWSNLEAFFTSLLGNEQAEWYFGWLSHTIKALYFGLYRVGQAVVIAGDPGCGKTLLACIVTKILGGRSGSPMAYLGGESDFNSELAESEHLVIDDDVSDSAPKTRRRLGAKLRGFVAARNHRIHPKGRQAIELRPFWRLTILLNSDPTSLSVLPQMEDSLSDKLALLMASRASFPIDDSDPAFEEKLWKCFTDELPAFVHYLINDHSIADDWVDRRFGIKAMHHDKVLALLEPPLENELLCLIDDHWASLTASQLNTAIQCQRSTKEAHARLRPLYASTRARSCVPDCSMA